jgi:hypothetical protein
LGRKPFYGIKNKYYFWTSQLLVDASSVASSWVCSVASASDISGALSDSTITTDSDSVTSSLLSDLDVSAAKAKVLAKQRAKAKNSVFFILLTPSHLQLVHYRKDNDKVNNIRVLAVVNEYMDAWQAKNKKALETKPAPSAANTRIPY